MLYSYFAMVQCYIHLSFSDKLLKSAAEAAQQILKEKCFNFDSWLIFYLQPAVAE